MLKLSAGFPYELFYDKTRRDISKKRLRRRLRFTWTSNLFIWPRWFKKRFLTCEVLTIFDNRFHPNIFHLRVFGYFISQKASICRFIEVKFNELVLRLSAGFPYELFYDKTRRDISKIRLRRRLRFTWTSNLFIWPRWFKKRFLTCEVLTIFDNRFHPNIFHLRVFGYFISQKASLCSFIEVT